MGQAGNLDKKLAAPSGFGRLFVALAVIGCSAPPTPAPQQPLTEALATPEPAEPVPSPAKPSPAAEPSGPGQAFGGEDPGGGKALSTKKAWAYSPGEGVGLHIVERSEATRATFFTFSEGGDTFEVPLAFVHPLDPPKKLERGDLVLATVVDNAICGVVRGIDGDKLEIGFVWGRETQSRSFPSEELLLLDGKLRFGAPALRRDGDAWQIGAFLRGDTGSTWLAPFYFGTDEAKAPSADVRALDVSSRRKKGERVIACAFEIMGCMETTIVAAKDGGLHYAVELPADFDGLVEAGAKVLSVSACQIGSLPK